MNALKRRIYRGLMRFLVWNMRFMTRYVGFIARPIVRIYAVNEVIACGVREPDGTVSILFTPNRSHRDHRIFISRERKLDEVLFHSGANYSEPCVCRAVLPEAIVGVHYKMKAVTKTG